MDVIPVKQHQPRSRAVKTVKIPTGHILPERWLEDKDRTTFYKQNSELWKTYRRLSSPQVESIGFRRIPCSPERPKIDFPGRDGMKCMCYEKLMKIITDNTYIPPPVIYRIPSRNPPRVTLDSVRPTWMKKAMDHYRKNEQLQYPLATISVRWQQKRSLLKYELPTLRILFERFGEVDGVRELTSNSCLVLFRDIGAACQAMNETCLGDPLNPLYCTWWHKSMANKYAVTRGKNGVAIKTDMFLV